MQVIQLPPPGVPHESAWLIAQSIAVVLATLGGVTGALMLIRALAQRLARPHQEALPSAEVAELHDTVQHLTGRVGELEERIDFAERLLARERDADRLKGPKA
jgi:ubiquinone biosynthesis protein UbiJ